MRWWLRFLVKVFCGVRHELMKYVKNDLLRAFLAFIIGLLKNCKFKHFETVTSYKKRRN